MPVDILYQQVGDIFGNGIYAVTVFIDLLFLRIPVVLFCKTFERMLWQIKQHFGGNRHNVFEWIEDKAIFNGLFHGVAVEGAPQFFALGIAAELAKAGEGVVVRGGGKADNQIFLDCFP